MTPSTYKRWQQASILSALKTRRVLVLAGSRQCGKTTLAKEIAGEDAIFRTLDDITLLEAALSDPHGFVHHNDNLMIIDEVQKAPVLLQAVKQDVDNKQAPGRFLLTGSANIQSLPGVTESLAGRVSKIRLRPLALGEIAGKPPQFLANAFQNKFEVDESMSADDNYSLKDHYLLKAISGGYPEALRQENTRESRRWLMDYLDALMERDLQDIINIKRQDSMNKLVEVLAAWSGKFMDVSAIGSGLSISRPSIIAYINALEALYLVERVRPWLKTDYERVSKQDKLFMTDTGLMSAILRWRFEKVQLDGERNGKLIETLVFTQLAAQIDAQDEDYQLYHYRDREKREIDFIVENEDGDVLGIEVKAGSVVNKSSFKHLIWFRDNAIKDNDFIGVVLYTGEHTLSFGDGLWAVPINTLWS